MRTIELPEEYALVLQQVDEDGGDDFNTLAENLRFDRRRLTHYVQSLLNMGLIAFYRKNSDDPWIRLSAKGRRLMRYLWPESALGAA